MHIKDNTNWDADRATAALAARFGKSLKSDYSLKDYNTYRTGGSTRLFIDVNDVSDLAALIKAVNEFNIPMFMLGGGSNVLVSDHGFNGIIIKNSFKGLRQEGSLIYSGAGEELDALVNFATECGLTGLEFAVGIYGTVGGAIYGNAGAYGGEISNILVEVELVDRQGNIKLLKAVDLKFDYRWSVFKETGDYITSAKFALKPGNKYEIQGRVDEILKTRHEKLPYDKCSAGCFFKNIPDKNEKYGKLAAGKLLEEVNAKGMRVGDAVVSEKHANIIVNEGKASSDDIYRLALKLKKNVKDKFNIDLTEEIILLGKFDGGCL